MEITWRTVQGRFLLRPGPGLNASELGRLSSPSWPVVDEELPGFAQILGIETLLIRQTVPIPPGPQRLDQAIETDSLDMESGGPESFFLGSA